MRVEVEERGEVQPPSRGVVEPIITVAPRRRRVDRFDLAMLAAFAFVSLWVLGSDLWHVVANGRVWTGTDGFFLTDQMQYVAWIRDASHHLLASNLFVLHPTANDYLQPIVVISGAIAALGVTPWLALLLWKPVAVLAAFYAIRAFARRSFGGLWERRSVLALGLFFGSVGVIGDMWTGFWSWGYPFGLLSLAAEFAALLAYDSARATGRRIWLAPVLGVIASALHPWQGETLALIVIATEVVLRAGRPGRGRWTRRLKLPLLTLIATALPLLYYAILACVDPSWELAREASRHTFQLSSILIALGPLLIPAALAYRHRPQTFLATATRAWPLAAFGVYVLSESDLAGTPLHAFAGVTVPLAVLAIEGIKRTRLRRISHRKAITILAVAVATIPASVYELATAHEFIAPTAGNANFITPSERDALNYLARDPASGGVLTRLYLGLIVPAETGRRTYVGDCLWSEPNCTPRAQNTQALLDGAMTPAAAQQFVLGTGARFVLQDCGTSGDLARSLAPIIRSVHSFGCATVYTVSRSRD